MRSDIKKVVFERAKALRTWTSKTPRVKGVVLDRDGELFDDASNSRRPKRRKLRNSHFNAVERFLVRSVGRPWDKVYAEVCASADARSLLGAQLRNFVQSAVATDCWFEGPKVMCHHLTWYPQEVRGLYVHPRTGILLRTKRECRQLGTIPLERYRR